MQGKLRPKFLDLFILAPKMAVMAKVSILHRVSGVLLFLAIPFIICLLHKSLTSTSFYESLYGVMATPVMKIIYLVFIWAFCHHLCAGVRFLFLDIDKGVEIKKARISAHLVMLVSIILTIALGVLIW